MVMIGWGDSNVNVVHTLARPVTTRYTIIIITYECPTYTNTTNKISTDDKSYHCGLN